jgi:predicted nucleic acid-binding protein
MIAVDTNILVYAHRPDLPLHAAAARCVEELATGASQWGLPWPCAHEFLAAVTNPRVFREPTPAAEALALLDELRTAGRCVFLPESDARIAAICLGHGVRELWSCDRDFSRFPSLRLRNPLISSPGR